MNRKRTVLQTLRCQMLELRHKLQDKPTPRHQYMNLSELINKKSNVDKVRYESGWRRAERQNTLRNFSTERDKVTKVVQPPPNPLTGFGYKDQKKGIKTSFPQSARLSRSIQSTLR